MSKQSNTFDRDLEPIRLRGRRFPLSFNVIVPFNGLGAQIVRPSWLYEPEADAYFGVPFTLKIPAGIRCLWTPRTSRPYEVAFPLEGNSINPDIQLDLSGMPIAAEFE